MIKMQNRVDQLTNEQNNTVDGRTEMPEESATVAAPRGVTVQIQGLLGTLNRLLQSYQGKANAQPESAQQSPAVQVTDLPGI